MKRSIVALAVATAMVLTAGAAAAQKGSKGPKTKVTQSSPKKMTGGGGAKLHASAAQGPKVKSATTTTKSHGPKTSTTTKTHGKPTTTTTAAATTKTKGTDHGRQTTTTTATATPAPATTPTTGVTTLTLSPVQQKLEKNTNLANKLQTRLGGADVIAAAERFPTLGSFVSAVNASANHDLSFTELKSRILDDGMSLGQAIKAERNDVDVTSAVTRAETEAKVMIAESESTTTTTKTKASKAPKAPKTKKRDGQ